MSKGIEAKIQEMMNYYRKRGYTVEKLADKYYIHKNMFAEAVMDPGGVTEEHYVKKEAARRLLLEKGVGYDNDRT